MRIYSKTSPGLNRRLSADYWLVDRDTGEIYYADHSGAWLEQQSLTSVGLTELGILQFILDCDVRALRGARRTDINSLLDELESESREWLEGTGEDYPHEEEILKMLTWCFGRDFFILNNEKHLEALETLGVFE